MVRAAKRSRVVEPEEDAAHRLTRFTEWMRSKANIAWSDQVIRFDSGADACPGDAFGVWAAKDLQSSDTIATIPKSALISIRNEGITEILEAERFNGGLGLALAVLYQQGLGPSSMWQEYLRFLPAREYIPLFWTDEELAMLRGTQVSEERVSNDKAAMREEFEEEVLPLVAKYPDALKKGAVTFEAFLRASAWMSSRSFFVDREHGEALVPLADIFNHKASVVQMEADPGSQWRAAELEDSDSDDDSCRSSAGGSGDEADGSESDGGGAPHVHSAACAHTHARAPADPAAASEAPAHCSVDVQRPNKPAGSSKSAGESGSGAEQTGDAPGTVAAASHANADCAAGGDAGTDCARVGATDSQGQVDGNGTGNAQASALALAQARFPGLNLKLEMWICCEEVDGVEVLVIKAAQDIAKGAEIHNTYGEHSNAELLYKYGFVLEENPFDAITVTPTELEEAAESVLGRRTARQRMRFVRDETNVMEDDGDVMSLAPRTVLSAPAAAVLLVLGAPEGVFQGWGGISDAVAWYNATAAGDDASATPASTAAAKGSEDAGLEGTEGAEELDMEDVMVAECGQHLSRSGIQILRSIVEQKLASYPALHDVGISEQSEQAAIKALQGRAGEGVIATRFAMMLRKTEKALLEEFLVCDKVVGV